MRYLVLFFALFSIISTFKITDALADTKAPAVQTVTSRIAISPADRTCRKDSDCAHVNVRCSCDCGAGVNKKFAEKYTQLVSKMCKENPPEKVCKVICKGEVKCKSRQCTYE